MHRFYRQGVIIAVSMITLAGCGGSGNSTPQSPTSITNPPATSTIVKATDYTGSWTGSYSSGATSTPITFSLVGVNAANVVTGSVYSEKLSGQFTGTLNDAGNIAGSVANIVDGNSWSVQLGILGNVLSIAKATYGAASLGIGSCTATPAMTVDMVGSWKGTINEKNVNTGFIKVGTTQNVDVELAYDGAGGFIGAIVSDKGLAARIKFVAWGGYWICLIDQASSWGSLILTPQSGTVASGGMIATAAMQQSFVANSAAPTGMSYIDLSETYSTGTYAPNGGEYLGNAEFLMTLTR